MVARLVRDQEAVGSSPVTSTKNAEKPFWYLRIFLLKAGLERLGSRNLTRGSSLRNKDCDQTIDGTIVCQTGVIANNGKEKQDE